MPAEVRPARPARWVAEASETGTVAREDNAEVGLYVRIYARILSFPVRDAKDWLPYLDEARVNDELNPLDSNASLGIW